MDDLPQHSDRDLGHIYTSDPLGNFRVLQWLPVGVDETGLDDTGFHVVGGRIRQDLVFGLALVTKKKAG